jgi:hypothetical protein
VRDEVALQPPPVRRFFERALTPGQRVISHATCAQAGTFLVRPPGRWCDPVTVEGMLVPSRGAVEWLLPEGPLLYWRASVTDITYRYR